MRIKLRLYPRDLDLLTLKQNPSFNLGAAIRQALYEYVQYGECSRIHVVYDPTQSISLDHDQVNISLTKEKYQDVVAWLSGIRPGLRNCAVKAIIRSAIANPVLFAFAENSNLIMNDEKMAAAVRSEKPAKKNQTTEKVPSPAETKDTSSPFAQMPATQTLKTPSPSFSATSAEDSDDDVWSMDIENY